MSKTEMYQKSMKWVEDAINYVDGVLKDPYGCSLDLAIKEKKISSRTDQEPSTTLVEITEPFTIIWSRDKDGINRANDFMTSFRKKLFLFYAKHCLKV